LNSPPPSFSFISPRLPGIVSIALVFPFSYMSISTTFSLLHSFLISFSPHSPTGTNL
jgi:hypothetical protein